MISSSPAGQRLDVGSDLLHHRGFLQDVQHPVACGKGVLQRAAQVGQGYAGAKGTHHGQGGDQDPQKIHLALLIQQRSGKKHPQAEHQDRRVGHRLVLPSGSLHARLVLGQVLCPGLHLCKPLLSLPILQDL